MSKNIGIIIGISVIVLILVLGVYFFLMPRCPKSCDDENVCTKESCSKETNYKCKIEAIPNCCGNKICELEENYGTCPTDCPNCDDDNKCTKDHYDYYNKECVNRPILDVVCCGNTVCETGETYLNCARDCPNCDDDNRCTKDSYDYHQQKCLNEIIRPCCGNGICDKGAETYTNCSADCPNCNDNSKLTLDSFNYTSQKCDYIITHYIFDNFEDGAGDWEFFGKEESEPITTNWTVIKDGTNTVLRGAGHNWAGILSKGWSNYIFKARFKVVREGDGIHFNFRNTMGESNPTRYFIWVGSNGVNLAKQINEKFFDSLAQPQNFPGFGKDFINVWHTFEIRGYGNILNILVDDKLLIKYKDNNIPVLSGGVAFETLNGSEFLIDDVEVKVISSQDIIYP